MKSIIHTLDQRTRKTWDDVFFEVTKFTPNLNRYQRDGIAKVIRHLCQKNYLMPHSFTLTVNDVGNSNGIIHLYYNIFGDDHNTVRYTINVSSPSGFTVSGLLVEIPRYGVRYSYLDFAEVPRFCLPLIICQIYQYHSLIQQIYQKLLK